MNDTHAPSALDLLANADLDPQMMTLLKFAMGQGQTSDALEEVESLRDRLATLERSNRDLLRMLDKLASAVGACRDCWGADPGCVACGGEGNPGFFPPERRAFEAFVLPVVRATAARVASAQRPPPTSYAPWAPSFVFHRSSKET